MVILFINFSNLFAQKPIQNSFNRSEKCGTQNWLNSIYSAYPAFRQQYLDNEKKLGQAIHKLLQQPQNSLINYRTNAIFYIPIVFHVVIPDQVLVPDVMILSQLNRINLDYAGFNTDSTNATVFYSVRGHSKIQFCLAQRTPSGTPTNGIDRVTSSILSNGSVGDPIKHTSTGGSDAWNPNNYLNIWIGFADNSDVLGYGTFPIGTEENNVVGIPQNEQGVFIIPGSLPGGDAIPYDGGRTLTHELGHFFWLRHIWGDADCGDDFPNTPGIDDTPQQNNETFGCPSGAVETGCTGSATPPGRMYQNFLDYTDDACMSMFTKGQNIRADQALLLFRPGLLSSNGCSPVIPLANDASIAAIVTPVNNANCLGANSPLTVNLKNEGSNTLTSATLSVEVNSVLVQTFNWIGNLAPGASVNLNLNNVNLIAGTNTIAVCTSKPNGTADSSPFNDCKIVIVFSATIPGPAVPLPIIEGFEAVAFPPPNWTRVNPDNDIMWQKNINGVVHGGIANAFINHFNYPATGQVDDIISPRLTVGTADSLWVSFWGAYKGFPNSSFEIIEAGVSTNCGNTFTTVYSSPANVDFGVDPVVTATNWFPSAINHWRKKSIDLSSFISAGEIIVRFRVINQHGNNFFLDDININKKIFKDNDAAVIAINNPLPKLCDNSGAPEVVIKNFGNLALTSVKINFQLDGTGPVTTFNWTGNLARNQTAIVTLPNANYGAMGSHSINAYTTLPNNVADQDQTNDGQIKSFKVYSILPIPGTITEDFTSTTFPPANWEVINPDGDLTWQRNSLVGKKAIGSAWINDFLNNTIDESDDLALPNYSYSGIDSIFMSFNLAHLSRTLPGTPDSRFDTLSVLLSKDCGNTYTTVYKKNGGELETVNNPSIQSRSLPFIPNNNQWRKDSINLGTNLSGTEARFQLSFRFSGNFENNFFLDDINIRTQVLPAKFKTQGYLILPNPFRNVFAVWHYLLPTNLRYINVYNSAGQLVWSKQFPNGGDKYIQIDLSGRSAGTYTVSVGYLDKKSNINIPVVKY